MLASRLDALKKDVEFKRWLTEAPDMLEAEAPEAETEAPEPGVESDDLMEMLKGRMA